MVVDVETVPHQVAGRFIGVGLGDPVERRVLGGFTHGHEQQHGVALRIDRPDEGEPAECVDRRRAADGYLGPGAGGARPRDA